MTTMDLHFLTCCRPIYNTTFCYFVETPRFINPSFYPFSPTKSTTNSQNVDCESHSRLPDHNLNNFIPCTDRRAWSNDLQSRRLHFFDITSGLVALCSSNTPRGVDENMERSEQREVLVGTNKELKEENQPDLPIKSGHPLLLCSQYGVPARDDPIEILPHLTLENKIEEDKLPIRSKERKSQDEISADIDEIYIKDEQLSDVPVENRKVRVAHHIGVPEISFEEEVQDTLKEIEEDELQVTGGHKEEKKLESQDQDLCMLTDDVIDKLEINLENLEGTFDKFVKKNRDFIQNLIQLLNFEKQKQNTLEEEYNHLKQENYILQTNNDYLKMLNRKQEDLFKNELDKGIRENKVIYTKKIQQLETQLKTEKEELKYYKYTEERYRQVVNSYVIEIERLNNEINVVKNKEALILKNYVIVLTFLEDVKQMLGSSTAIKGITSERSLTTIGDPGSSCSLIQVLKTALRNGMQTLNVRELSIMHDAIQELNEHLCHQYGFCGRHSTPNLSVSHMSMTYTHLMMEDHLYPATATATATSYMPGGFLDYKNSSNLSIIPSRQKPESGFGGMHAVQ